MNMKLTKNEFVAICAEFAIDPAIALESEAVVRALKTGCAELNATTAGRKQH